MPKVNFLLPDPGPTNAPEARLHSDLTRATGHIPAPAPSTISGPTSAAQTRTEEDPRWFNALCSLMDRSWEPSEGPAESAKHDEPLKFCLRGRRLWERRLVTLQLIATTRTHAHTHAHTGPHNGVGSCNTLTNLTKHAASAKSLHPEGVSSSLPRNGQASSQFPQWITKIAQS